MDANAKLEEQPDIEQHAQRIDKLSVFREEIGITDVLPLSRGEKRRTADNIGIFKRTVDAERNARRQYYAVASLINACLLLQIVFASALTALGASGSSHTTITIFGALNTVIAGILSFTKGQGLPSRLRQYQNSLRKVREYIEQRERDFGQLDCSHDVQHEIRKIISMYKSTRESDENNDPSVYQAASGPPGTGKDPLASTPVKSRFGLSSLDSFADKLKDHVKSHSDKGEASGQGENEGSPSKGRDDRHDQALLRQVAERMLANDW